MKICWDNLEGVRLTKSGTLVKGTQHKEKGCIYHELKCIKEEL